MAERATISQIVQIGIESTPGSAVSATKRLATISFEPTIQAEVDEFRAAGTKYRALTALSKEWTAGRMTGRGSYTEMVYGLSACLGTATITTPGGGTTSRQWEFSPLHVGADSPKTLTVERGEKGGTGERSTGALLTEFGMTFDRKAVAVEGQMLARAMSKGVTMTPSGVTDVALVPILPTQLSVFLDTTAAGLGGTRLTRVTKVAWKISNRFGPVWVLDASQNSYVATVELEPKVEVALTMEADTQGMALLDNLRSGSRRFLRIEAIGSIIEGSIPYRFTLDTSVEMTQPSGQTDEDGLFAVGWTFTSVYDATWTKAMNFQVVNTLLAL